MKTLSTHKGFTIIEVVLVLAIAGLIFLMVFVALPALQRSQRDTQRRNDMSRLATALTNWQVNHSNSLPSGVSTTTSSQAHELLTNYLKSSDDLTQSEFKDPSGQNYTLNVTTATSTNGGRASSTANEIMLYTNTHCDGETAVVPGTNNADGNTNYAIVYALEGSGSICLDNK